MRETLVKTEEFKDSPVGQIPKDWRVMKIGEACSLLKDGTHLPPKRVESGPLLLSVQNMIDSRLQLTDSDTRISWDFYKTMHRNWEIQVGDVLMAIVGATLGKTAIVPPMPPFTLQRSVAVFRGKPETLKNSFLYLYLSSEAFQRLLWHRVNQTAQPGIYLAELAAFYIPLPSLKEQESIAEILDTVDEAIAHTSSLIAKLKQMKAGLLHDLLTRGLDENGELRDAIAHPEQFKDSPLGQIPKEWKFCKFGDQVTLQRGFDITSKEMRPGNVPVIASSGLVGYHDTPMANPPGVITGRKGSLGEAFYIEEPYYPTDTTLWVTDFHGNYPKFVRRFIQWMRLERLDSATACPTLNRNFVHPIPVTFPPVNEQIRIDKVLDTYDNRIRTEETYRDKLKLQKQGLMHDLLTGKVRVKI